MLSGRRKNRARVCLANGCGGGRGGGRGANKIIRDYIPSDVRTRRQRSAGGHSGSGSGRYNTRLIYIIYVYNVFTRARAGVMLVFTGPVVSIASNYFKNFSPPLTRNERTKIMAKWRARIPPYSLFPVRVSNDNRVSRTGAN